MSVTKESEHPYSIITTETGYIMVRYDETMNIVKLRKILALENQYELTTNFSEYKRKRITKNRGVRLAKELLLKQYLESKKVI